MTGETKHFGNFRVYGTAQKSSSWSLQGTPRISKRQMCFRVPWKNVCLSVGTFPETLPPHFLELFGGSRAGDQESVLLVIFSVGEIFQNVFFAFS
jgi:hypothetical protein